jgi:hypothetical protein
VETDEAQERRRAVPLKRKNAGGQFLEYCIATQDTTTV